MTAATVVALVNQHGMSVPWPVLIGAVVVIFVIAGVMFARRKR